MLANLDEIREACLNDLYTFACIVHPTYIYGEIHKEVYRWFQEGDPEKNKLLLLPRAHLKSHMVATLAAWLITRDPATSILYISATANLCDKQIRAIKNILTSPVYSRLWPDMVNKEENKREKWTSTEICVDHPKRKEEGVRDSTIFIAGLTTTITGLHSAIILADDVVVKETAYTADGRKKVEEQCSQLSSILNPAGKIYAVGTRYHPKDYWNTVINMEEEDFDEEGNIIGTRKVYEVFERVVETDGVFLWPRTANSEGTRWEGFNNKVLARKKAEYTDKTQFYAQYYNDPNDPESRRFTANDFNYYERKYIQNDFGNVTFKGKKLNVFAAIDFALSTSKTADYTAIAIVGVDCDGYIYVLDLDRFKTDKVLEYYNALHAAYIKWNFRKLRVEVTVAQQAIATFIKDEFRKDGIAIFIDEHRPNKSMGSKEERIAAILEPRYQNQTILHFKGGLTPTLEEEVILSRPPHDDLKDALSNAIDIAKAPAKRKQTVSEPTIKYHPRFGGISF